MSSESLTRHASIRMAQRGFCPEDLDLIRLLGIEVKDGYLVRAKECQAFERQLKRMLDRVRRLIGTRVVVAGDHIVTTYHARPTKERQVLRRAEDRELAL